MTSGETSGAPFNGRTMLRWFSITTLPNSSINLTGSVAATRRRLCSLDVVRCNKTHGSSMHSQSSPSRSLKYGS